MFSISLIEKLYTRWKTKVHEVTFLLIFYKGSNNSLKQISFSSLSKHKYNHVWSNYKF